MLLFCCVCQEDDTYLEPVAGQFFTYSISHVTWLIFVLVIDTSVVLTDCPPPARSSARMPPVPPKSVGRDPPPSL